MNKQKEEERVSHLFGVVISLFERFVEKTDQEIMDPFFNGDIETATENLKIIDKRLTIDKLLSLIFKNFEELVLLRININKHYGSIETDADREAMKEVSNEFDLKMFDIFESFYKAKERKEQASQE